MKNASSSTILCVQSNRWASLLLRNLGDDANLRWALDINDMIFEAKSGFGAACIVELDSNSSLFTDHCQRLHDFSNNSCGARLFVVGDHGLFHWSSALRRLDAAFVCRSTLDVESLVGIVQRHHQSQPSKPISIETWAERNLPWSIQNQD